jgi:hypothetical protein
MYAPSLSTFPVMLLEIKISVELRMYVHNRVRKSLIKRGRWSMLGLFNDVVLTTCCFIKLKKFKDF